MRPRFGTVLALAIMGGVLFPAPVALGQLQTGPLDHFQCYKARFSAFGQETVQIHEGNTDYDATVGKAAWFCNPVKKKHAGTTTKVLDQNDHFVWYRIEAPEWPGAEFPVRNQFGEAQQMKITDRAYLAVPTRKKPHGDPGELDHNVCFTATGDAVNAKVGLRDQWLRRKTAVIAPRAVCVPVQKTHDGQVFAPQNPYVYQVCYATKAYRFPRDDRPRAKFRNQFGNGKVTGVKALLLCVPSYPPGV